MQVVVAACPRWRRRRIPVWLPPLAALALLGCPLPPGPTISQLQVQQSGAVVSSYDFGTRATGAPGSPVTFTIHNQGSTPIDLASVQLTDTSDFSASVPSPSPVSAGDTASFTVTFTPASYEIPLTCTVTVRSVNGSSSYSFTLHGMGTSGVFELRESDNLTPVANGTLIDFGRVANNTPVSWMYYIHNLSTVSDDLILLTPTLSGDTTAFSYSLTANPVPPGQSQSFSIVGGRKGLPDGTYNATLTITTSDVGHPTSTLYLTMVFSQGI
jgi:hypothetical protein